MLNNIWKILVGSFGASDSPFGTINKKDVLKVLRTAAIAGIVSAVAVATGMLQDVSWGVVGPLAIAVLEAVQRWLKDNSGGE